MTVDPEIEFFPPTNTFQCVFVLKKKYVHPGWNIQMNTTGVGSENFGRFFGLEYYGFYYLY